MKPEEKVAKEVLLKATEDLLGEKRELLEEKKTELEKFKESNKEVLDKFSSLKEEIIELAGVIAVTEKVYVDVRDTKKIKRGSSTCVV